jgi:hypothetical protein
VAGQSAPKKCCLVNSSFSFLPFSSLHGKSRERSAVHSIATSASEPHAAPKGFCHAASYFKHADIACRNEFPKSWKS